MFTERSPMRLWQKAADTEHCWILDVKINTNLSIYSIATTTCISKELLLRIEAVSHHNRSHLIMPLHYLLFFLPSFPVLPLIPTQRASGINCLRKSPKVIKLSKRRRTQECNIKKMLAKLAAKRYSPCPIWNFFFFIQWCHLDTGSGHVHK